MNIFITLALVAPVLPVSYGFALPHYYRLVFGFFLSKDLNMDGTLEVKEVERFFGKDILTYATGRQEIEAMKPAELEGMHTGLYGNTTFFDAVTMGIPHLRDHADLAVQDPARSNIALKYQEYLRSTTSSHGMFIKQWPVNKIMGLLFASVIYYCDTNFDGKLTLDEFIEFARKEKKQPAEDGDIYGYLVTAVLEAVLGSAIGNLGDTSTPLSEEQFSALLKTDCAKEGFYAIHFAAFATNLEVELGVDSQIPLDKIREKWLMANSVENAFKMLVAEDSE